MNKEELQKYIGTEELTVIEAMQKIDANTAGLLYIVDEKRKLSGCLTDGDIRRWIIRTGDLRGRALQMMNRNPRYLLTTELHKEKKGLEEKGIYSMPIINADREIVDIVFREERVAACGITTDSAALEGVPVIIMAGGKGTRLYPYTKILPKPLIPIGEIPILERIFNRFYKFGAKEFFLTVNYKKEIIKSYFFELRPPYKIHYVDEEIPLGTAGSIRLIDRNFESPVIITNCDTLVEADFGKILEYHAASGNSITVISALKNIVVPYGVLHAQKNGIVASMEEKPQLSYMINTGMYIVDPIYLKLIPEGKVFHMTELIACLLEQEKRVGMYPISENSFLDMGEFEEMKKMEERINSGDMN